MRFLVAGDFGDARISRRWDAGGDEVGRGEFGDAFAVEGCFEVFEGEGVLEDVDWEEECVSDCGWGGFGLGGGRDALSEKPAKVCLLLRVLGKAKVEAARPRTVAYLNMITKMRCDGE